MFLVLSIVNSCNYQWVIGLSIYVELIDGSYLILTTILHNRYYYPHLRRLKEVNWFQSPGQIRRYIQPLTAQLWCMCVFFLVYCFELYSWMSLKNKTKPKPRFGDRAPTKVALRTTMATFLIVVAITSDWGTLLAGFTLAPGLKVVRACLNCISRQETDWCSACFLLIHSRTPDHGMTLSIDRVALPPVIDPI